MKLKDMVIAQQAQNPKWHYVNYAALSKTLRTAAARGNRPSAGSAAKFEMRLESEIALVNTCFERSRLALLERIAALAPPACPTRAAAGTGERQAAAPAQLRTQSTSEARRELVGVLAELDALRAYAGWNSIVVAHAIKRRRHMAAGLSEGEYGALDTEDEETGLGKEIMSWLYRQSFFNGSDFAELYIAVQRLEQALSSGTDGPLGAATDFAARTACHRHFGGFLQSHVEQVLSPRPESPC